MSITASAPIPHPVLIPEPPHHTTLLELVRTVGEVTQDDREVVATVLHMLRSGSVQLAGTFRGRSPDEFLD